MQKKMKTLRNFLNESILDSVKDKLSPDLWATDSKLKPSAKSFIVSRLKSWLKTVSSKEIQHLFLLGSMSGYQYSPDADVDVNFVIDISDDRLKELSKILPNGHNLPGTQHPVNYYISNKVKEEWKKSGPVYDILKERWISKPSKKDAINPYTNYRAVSEVSRFFINAVESSISEFNADVANYQAYISFLEDAQESEKDEIQDKINQKLYEIVADIDAVDIAYHMVYALRKEAFETNKPINIKTEIKIKDANTSINNLIYKYLEKLGYFDKIHDILDSREKWEKRFNK